MPTQIIQFHIKLPLNQDATKLFEWIKLQLVQGSEIDLKNLLRWDDDSGEIVQTVVETSLSASADMSRDHLLEGFITYP